MRNVFSSLIFSLAFMASNAWAEGPCGTGGTFMSFDDWRGDGCYFTNSTQPSDTVPPGQPGYVLPNSTQRDLTRFYANGQRTPIEFILNTGQLQLVSSAGRKHVDVFELGLMSPTNGSHLFALSVERSPRTSGSMLVLDWQSYLEAPQGGGEPTAQSTLTRRVELTDYDTNLRVSIIPVEGWRKIAVSIAPENKLAAKITESFAVSADSRGQIVPQYLRFGIIAGDLDLVGMTTAYVLRAPFVVSNGKEP